MMRSIIDIAESLFLIYVGWYTLAYLKGYKKLSEKKEERRIIIVKEHGPFLAFMGVIAAVCGVGIFLLSVYSKLK